MRASELKPSCAMTPRLPIVHIFLDHPPSAVHASLDRSRWDAEYFGGVSYLQFLDLAKPNDLAILGRQLLKEFCDDARAFSALVLQFGIEAPSRKVVGKV
jgi:hypothetical protein